MFLFCLFGTMIGFSEKFITYFFLESILKEVQMKRRKVKTGRARAKPGTKGKGKYYRVVVRPKSQFKTFRIQVVGTEGTERLAGKRKDGSWDTEAWLIPKKHAHVSGGTLVGDTAKIRNILSKLGSKPRRVKKDIFRAKPRKDIPEKAKPTAKMRRAQKRNIKKAQAAKRKKRK